MTPESDLGCDERLGTLALEKSWRAGQVDDNLS